MDTQVLKMTSGNEESRTVSRERDGVFPENDCRLLVLGSSVFSDFGRNHVTDTLKQASDTSSGKDLEESIVRAASWSFTDLTDQPTYHLKT